MKHIAEQLHCVRKDLDEPADEKLEGVFQNGYALMVRQFYPIKADHGAVLTTSAQRQAALDLTPLPVFKEEMITFPAPRHQVYDVINDEVEANEIPMEEWYPEGHKPDRVKEWPLTKDVTLPNPFAPPPE